MMRLRVKRWPAICVWPALLIGRIQRWTYDEKDGNIGWFVALSWLCWEVRLQIKPTEPVWEGE